MERPIGVGFIGCGLISELHHLAVSDSDVGRLIGVFDVDEARAAERARAWGVRAYDSLERMLDDEAIEAVFVLSPLEAHKEQVLVALQHGKHVLVEWTFLIKVFGTRGGVAYSWRDAVFQNERRLALGSVWQDHDLVIASDVGTPLNHANVYHRFIKLSAQAGVRRIPYHSLRHSHATILIARGVNAKVVAERLGHADISTTLRFYTEVLPDMQEEAAAIFDAAIAAPAANRP